MHKDTQNTSSAMMADIQTMRDTSKYNINIILKLILKQDGRGRGLDSCDYGQA
jgi:hypothetical protein